MSGDKKTTKDTTAVPAVDSQPSLMDELKAWVRREMHLHATGHNEDERKALNP